MIDIHCHLLPGIDDGPPTVEGAMALAKALVDDGITQVVVTPHVYPGRFENWRSSIADEHARFSGLLRQAGLPLQLLRGGEVRLTPEVLDLLARDELPFLGQVGGYRTLLLEMPDGQVPLGALNFVRHLLKARVRPVIVHPERNRGVMEKLERLQPLVDEGCYVQVTAGSLVGQFGARAQAVAAELLERCWVHAVASDAHNTTSRRPRMRDAAAWITQHHGAAVARELTVLGPAGLCAQNAAANGAAPDDPPQRQTTGQGSAPR
jgi:protein-tyrosine phosphatase